jgi:signal peptidase I
MKFKKIFNSLFILGLLLPLILASCTSKHIVEIQGNSLEPNLSDGDIVAYVPVELSELKRGDLVCFERKNGHYIKRLIGLPGETVEVHDGKVYIDGIVLEESYQVLPGKYKHALKLGENNYYVLGDNRDFSADSHLWGPISGDQILGVVVP